MTHSSCRPVPSWAGLQVAVPQALWTWSAEPNWMSLVSSWLL
ncbi:hypothetical protein [Kibdelosporangium aridum]